MATTWNPADLSTPVVLSNGNLTVTTSSSANGGVRSNASKASGKIYFEIAEADLTGANSGAGIATSTAVLTTMGGTPTNACLIYFSGSIYFNGSNTLKSIGTLGGGGVI